MKRLLRVIENLIVKYQNYKILKFLNEKNTENILDVGGHHAEFYKAFIENNIDFSSYMIFEPFPESFEIINKIEDSRLKKFNLGVGENKSSMTFNVSEWETSNTFSEVDVNTFKNKLKKVIYRTDPYITKLEVQVDSLDNICLKLEKTFDVLKIDVEGFELNVLKGANLLLSSNLIRYIVIEIQKEGSYLDYSPLEIEKYLDNKGFKLEKTFKILGLGIEDRIYKNTNI
jgi:FkbM family methyltransferase|tara:strand:+ start:104 stop:790 length:687 start_codon:yes stop_codon:yes gene_type:complete